MVTFDPPTLPLRTSGVRMWRHHRVEVSPHLPLPFWNLLSKCDGRWPLTFPSDIIIGGVGVPALTHPPPPPGRLLSKCDDRCPFTYFSDVPTLFPSPTAPPKRIPPSTSRGELSAPLLCSLMDPAVLSQLELLPTQLCICQGIPQWRCALSDGLLLLLHSASYIAKVCSNPPLCHSDGNITRCYPWVRHHSLVQKSQSGKILWGIRAAQGTRDKCY